jgi:phosphoribosylformylglycinamidine synthase
MASAEFNENSEEKRPTVQVGDPFTEKLLIEACLELMATDAIVAIQDMGAAGLTSSSFEMASKGGVGVELNLDAVPAREHGMTAYEFLLSESQERMLMVLKPGAEETARGIFEKWELDFAVVGTLTDTGRMVVTMNGKVEADLPIDPLALASPEYDRPWDAPQPRAEVTVADVAPPEDVMEALKTLVSCPDLASKRWIWEQYDHLVMGDTIQRPGGDAGVVRVQDTGKALAVTTDCTPRYCAADPREGAKQAVAEAWRNLTAVGATPLAVTDNMNFGNPERPRIMGQFVGCIEGIREACDALAFPVVSGNVSFYNETNGEAIPPTPAIGAVGLLSDAAKNVGLAVPGADLALVLIGDTKGHFGASLYLREIAGREDGAPPPVDLAAERRNGDFVRARIEDGAIAACHDVSDGGILVAAAEMAMAGNIGIALDRPAGSAPDHAWLFGEDQGRYLAVTADAVALLAAADIAGVPARAVGQTGGEDITFGGHRIAVADLRAAHEAWLPEYMAAP